MMNLEEEQKHNPDAISIIGTTPMEIQEQPLADDREEGPSKRQAMKGQWQTPPVGEIFPSSSSASQGGASAVAVNPANIPVGNLPVPSTSDDYARALQEAYRRGAEAAAALTHPSGSKSGNSIGISVQSFPITTAQGGSANTISSSPTSNITVHPASVPSNNITSGTTNSATKMGVPSPLPFFNNAAPASIATNTAAPAKIDTAPMINQQPLVSNSIGSYIPETVTSTTTSVQPTAVSPPKTVNRSQRSASMPDMSSYNNDKPHNDEEAKRLKRLARNRASARLRRLRKKNLVESYEAEVGVLESSLTKLRAHRWGVGADSDALLEALSMDRGQQQIDKGKRTELIESILSQQREQVKNLMDCQLENMVLGWVAQHGTFHDRKQETHIEAELDELAAELNGVLNLSQEQKVELKSASEGMEEEQKAIEIIYASLTALMSNSWLMNSGIEECTEQFNTILNPTQMSKFLLWADHNSEAIDQLDYVNAPPANAEPNTSPTFVFGIDETAAGEDG